MVPQDGEPEVATIGGDDRRIMDGNQAIGVRLLPDELVDLAPFARENPSARESWILVSRRVSAEVTE